MSQAQPNVVAFEVSLYFKGAPNFSTAALLKAWEDAGNGLELVEDKDALLSLHRASSMRRGEDTFDIGQFVRLSKVQPVDHSDAPTDYPAVCEPHIDYDATYLNNHQSGWADFHTATHAMRVQFNMLETSDKTLPNMELVGVLNSIHQLAPVHAMQFHHLHMLVGGVETKEFLDYATDYPDNPPRFCPMLAFGVFCTQSPTKLEGWTTGLSYFGPHEFWMQTPTRPPIDLMRVMFNLGRELAEGSRRYQPGETASVAELFVEIKANDDFDGPVLELVLR